jgi:hypothetical protein
MRSMSPRFKARSISAKVGRQDIWLGCNNLELRRGTPMLGGPRRANGHRP